MHIFYFGTWLEQNQDLNCLKWQRNQENVIKGCSRLGKVLSSWSEKFQSFRSPISRWWLYFVILAVDVNVICFSLHPKSRGLYKPKEKRNKIKKILAALPSSAQEESFSSCCSPTSPGRLLAPAVLPVGECSLVLFEAPRVLTKARLEAKATVSILCANAFALADKDLT